MAIKEQIYSGTGTLDNLKITCNADEDVFRAKLAKLDRLDDTKNTKATYQRLPFDVEYVKKELFLFDTTGGNQPTPPAGTTEILKDAQVYLNGAKSTVTVYRQN